MTTLQLFPDLDPATEAALRASIVRFGVLVPVVHDQDGRTIDGHHRERIAAELGAPYEVTIVTVADDDEAREVARTLNEDRRQLTTVQRRAIVADLRSEGHSLPAIAGAVGASTSQVARDVAELSREGKLTPPERIIGRDGKSRPAAVPHPHRSPASLPPAPGRGETPTVTEARRRFEAAVTAAGGPETDEGQRLLEDAEAEQARLAAEIAAESRGWETVVNAPEVVEATEHERFARVLAANARVLTEATPGYWADRLDTEEIEGLRSYLGVLRGWITEWEEALNRPALRAVGGR